MIERILENHEEVAGDEAQVYASIAHKMRWWMNRPFARDVLSLGLSSGCVLDVGCGTGSTAAYLARYAPGVKIWALDISPDMLQAVGAQAAAAGLGERIVPVPGDMKDLPFGRSSFDIVISSFALHHLGDPATGIGEMLRVLKPGGALMVRDLVRPASRARIRLMVEFFGSCLAYSRAEKKQYEDSLCAGFTRDELAAVAASRGLEVRYGGLSCFSLIRRPRPARFSLPAKETPGAGWGSMLPRGLPVHAREEIMSL